VPVILQRVQTRLRNPLSFLIPIFLLSFELIIGFLQAPWGVDAHHDGIVYGAAVAASEGRKPNSEYFQQYGPLASSIQGFFLHLTSPSLYNLRIFTAITVAAITLSIYFAARKVLSRQGSFAIAALWSISSPRMHATMLPWASFYSTIFLLLSILLIKKFSNRYYFGFNIGYFISAVMMTLACLCRINVIGTVCTVFFILALKREWVLLKAIAGGFIFIFAVFNLLGAELGFLKDFYYQCVFWAFSAYSTSGAEDIKGHFVNILMYLTIPFFGLAALYSSNLLRSKLFLPIIFIFLLTTLWSKNLQSSHESYANPLFLYAFISQHASYMFSYLGIFLSISACILFLKKKAISIDHLVISAIGASTLFQLYPTPDPLHLWWVAPVGLCAVFSFLDRDFGVGLLKFYSPGFSKLAVVLLIILSLPLIQEVRTQRFTFESSTLQKMQGLSKVDIDLDKTLQKLESENVKGNVVFDCPDGIYAAAGGVYLPNGKDYVNWSPKPAVQSEDSKFIFVCNSKAGPKKYKNQLGWRVVFEQKTANGFNFLLKREPNE
jgi:hypothetical protein